MIPIIGVDAIRPHLDVERLIPSADAALRAISAATAQTPLFILHPNTWSDIHVKSAALPDFPIFTVKMAGWSQKLAEKGEPASSGMIVVFDSETCRPIAILNDEHLISDYRTAAAGAVAAKLLAPVDARRALIIGTGVQAFLQTKALLAVRSIDAVDIWGRDEGKTSSLVARLRDIYPHIDINIVEDLQQSAPAADVIVTATAAKEPVLQAEWVRPGQHITSVGSDDASKCELDPQILASAQVFVDSKTSALAFGSTQRALHQDLLCADDLVELGSALEAGHSYSKAGVTVACLTGLGVQDLTVVNSLWPLLRKDV